MNNRKLYPSKEIHIKEEFSPYVKYEKIKNGRKLYINIPHKYEIELKIYNLIPGITVIVDYSNLTDHFRTSDDILYYEHPEDTLLINFVSKGQLQYEIEPDKYMFVKENDISMYIKKLNPKSFRYVGNVTLFHILINRTQIQKVFQEYNKENMEIIDKLFEIAKKENCTIFKAQEKILQNAAEYKNYPLNKELSSKLFFRLKAFESLVLLYEFEIEDEKNIRRTYSDAQIRVVRNIKNSLSRNIASYVSLDSLSMSYGINLTTLKNCFKDMYGKPLYTWYKEYKFNRAKELIKNTDYPISKIAYMIGYKSSSKFAKAFKKEMGVLPSSYRKNKK
ncbi:MAG: hypothetical protein BZ138_02470 [Methanosphaera sp. rholeuAM270]|nr:MAG: hypothetical protein BZ138_02470 [Methanosphaera sp. rholeuAM270]